MRLITLWNFLFLCLLAILANLAISLFLLRHCIGFWFIVWKQCVDIILFCCFPTFHQHLLWCFCSLGCYTNLIFNWGWPCDEVGIWFRRGNSALLRRWLRFWSLGGWNNFLFLIIINGRARLNLWLWLRLQLQCFAFLPCFLLFGRPQLGCFCRFNLAWLLALIWSFLFGRLLFRFSIWNFRL